MLPCYTIGEVCPPFDPHGFFATSDMYSVWTEKVIFSDVYQYVSLEGHLEIFWGKTLPQLLEKWFLLQGERAHSQSPISIQIKSKSNPNHFCSSFFLCLQGQPELCGSYHLLQSCFSFFVHLHGEPFSSYHILQSCFSFFIRLHGQTEPFGSCIILQFCSSYVLLPSPRPTWGVC